MATTDTGSYTLSQLLSADAILTIPDMQRDYCWGRDNASPEQPCQKVTPFIEALVTVYRSNPQHRPRPMGMIYGYALPPGSHNIMIIDGQQRLTTLYLLLGMLYRRAPSTKLLDMLVDETSPRLVYQVRNEAIFFMADLVKNFFLQRDGRLSQLENSPWYFRSYDTDNTVQSFISAIRHIDSALEKANGEAALDFDDFARFVTDDLRLTYYDIGLRSRAEKMFITLNTTGQPLTHAQTLKTTLYARSADKDAFARRWEEMERWFWHHRSVASTDDLATADNALERFLDFYDMYSALCAENQSATTLSTDNSDDLFDFFDTYSRLCEEIPEALCANVSDTNHVMAVLGAMSYIQKFGAGVRPYWDMLVNISRYQRAPVSGADARSAIELPTLMHDADILSLLKIKGKHRRLLNDEERAKLRALSRAGNGRKRLRKILRRGERHPLLCGRMYTVLSWCMNPSSGIVDIDYLDKCVDTIYSLWGEDLNATDALDGVRTLLLSLNHPDYPMRRRSGSTPTLCTKEYEWQRLMLNHPDCIHAAIDAALSRKSSRRDKHKRR